MKVPEQWRVFAFPSGEACQPWLVHILGRLNSFQESLRCFADIFYSIEGRRMYSKFSLTESVRYGVHLQGDIRELTWRPS